jgi:hypothetical protein
MVFILVSPSPRMTERSKRNSVMTIGYKRCLAELLWLHSEIHFSYIVGLRILCHNQNKISVIISPLRIC